LVFYSVESNMKLSFEGVQITDYNPIPAHPTFVSDHAGTYRLRLVVNDGVSASAPDLVVVTAAPITTLTVTPANPSIILGQTKQFAATASFADNTNKDATALAA
jgi:uncharacterized protein YjdB